VLHRFKILATWLGLKLLEAAGLPEVVVLDAQLFIEGDGYSRGRGTVTVYKRWVRLAELDESALPQVERIISWYPTSRVAEIYDCTNEKGGLYVDEDEAEIFE